MTMVVLVGYPLPPHTQCCPGYSWHPTPPANSAPASSLWTRHQFCVASTSCFCRYSNFVVSMVAMALVMVSMLGMPHLVYGAICLGTPHSNCGVCGVVV